MPNVRTIDRFCRWRVQSGPFLLAAVFLAAHPDWRSLAMGLGIVALGLLLRAWAAGHIQKEKTLAVSGPYRHSRNPLYLGNLILGIGIAVAVRSWWGALLVGLYFALFYPPVILVERGRMERLFPQAYKDYAAQVPLFFPRLTPAPGFNDSPFRWTLYRRNRESRALLGTGLVWLILVAKMIIF